ncbi:MAG: hypothetical protein ABL907_00175 [Hyphomicrobium sp.]
MTDQDAMTLIQDALKKVAPAKALLVNSDTNLISDGILDSLDVMSFLFEVEQRLGHKMTAIDETFSDFRVSRLIEIIKTA